jgi:6-pyruvoyltetrahydropterin/6-carboxytetrahydropterin synthase
MFEVAVQAEFSAAHAIRIGATLEPVHGHNWHITATIAGPSLDRNGLLLDFHLVEAHLREIAALYDNANLNELEPFRSTLNPTAENVARHIADELARRLEDRLPPGAAITSVRITEAPGCAATYYPSARMPQKQA